MNKTFSFPLLFLLVGCGGMHTNIAQQNINHASKQEMAAWEKANEEAMAACPAGVNGKPLPRSKAIELHNCRVTLIEKYVRPVSYSPMDLNQYILDQKRVSLAYKNGKIDKDEANLQVNNAFHSYVMRMDQKSRQELMLANQKDMALSQQLGQMSQQINSIEAQNQQRLRDNRPVNTNCRRFGDSVNCTTW